MENDKFLKLTNTVYKVLEFFPESDPLKNRAKDRALTIMEHLIVINETSGWASFQKEKVKSQLLEDIDALLGYLWIGKTQGWLSSSNFLIIANEYEKIKKESKPIIELTQKLPGILDKSPAVAGQFDEPASISPLANLGGEMVSISDRQNPPSREVTARQGKILEFLKNNEKAQVMDLQKILPDITKRTIRRDLDELLEMNKIARLGEFNQIFYKIK